MDPYQLVYKTRLKALKFDAPQPDQGAVFEETLSVADLALVVVRPEEEDLTRIDGIVSQIDVKGLPFIFVINRVPPGGDMATATAIALAQQGTVCPANYLSQGWP